MANSDSFSRIQVHLRPAEKTLKDVGRYFVDRSPELRRFEDVLKDEDEPKPVLVVNGEKEIGKTWLLHRYYAECMAKGDEWLVVLVQCSKGDFNNYLDILRYIHLALGQEFRHFQETVAKQLNLPIELKMPIKDPGKGHFVDHDPERVRGDEERGDAVEYGGDKDGDDTSHGPRVEGDYAGGDMFKGDMNLSATDRSAISLSGDILQIENFYVHVDNQNTQRKPYIIPKLTAAFLRDLVAFVGDRPILFLFDDIGTPGSEEHLDPKTRDWLIEDFIVPLCEGALSSARFVITHTGELEVSLLQQLYGYFQPHTLAIVDSDENKRLAIYEEFLLNHGIDKEKLGQEKLREFDQMTSGKPGKMFKRMIIMKLQQGAFR
jgi:hypothetical protein